MIRLSLVFVFLFRVSLLADALAPHPISIGGPLGQPGSEVIEVDGDRYKVTWDGTSLSLEKVFLAPKPDKPDESDGYAYVEMDGKRYKAGFDGSSLRNPYGRPAYGEPPINEGPPGLGWSFGDEEPPRVNVHLRAYISVLILGGGLWGIILTGIFCTWETWLLTSVIIANVMVLWIRWCANYPNKKN